MANLPEEDALYNLMDKEYKLTNDLLEINDDQDVENQRKNLIRNYLLEVLKEPNLPQVHFDCNWEWFNTTKPLLSEHLLGRTSVLDFFTYCCINCMHVLPDLDELEKAVENILVIGVHSAKFENEKVSLNIKHAIERYDITHPVVNDSQAVLWKQYLISCWPTFMVLDPKGRPVRKFVGEGHGKELIEFVKIAEELFEELGLKENNVIELPQMSFGTLMKPSLLSYPGKVHATSTGQLVVSDTSHHRIIIVEESSMEVKMIVGCGRRGYLDAKDDATKAEFNSPQGTCLVEPDLLYICDTGNHALRVCNLTTGNVTTVAGNTKQGKDYQGGLLGNKQALASPWDICRGYSPGSIDNKGDPDVLFIAMAGTHQIWGYMLTNTIWWKKVEREAGRCYAIAGSGAEENRNTSYPLKAGFAQPSGISYDMEGDILYIADSESSSVRKLNIKDGSVNKVIGGGRDPNDLFSYGDIDGKGIDAKLQHPLGVSFIPSNRTLIVADSYNHKLKIIQDLDQRAATCQTIPGIATNEPGGLSLSNDGFTLYVADTNNHAVKAIDMNTYTSTEIKPVLQDQDCTDDGKLQSQGLDICLYNDSGMFTLEVQLKTKNGTHFNQEAPSTWKIDLPQGWTNNSGLKGPIDGNKLSFNICYNFDPEMDKTEKVLIKLGIKVYLCSDKDATCTCSQSNYEISCRKDNSFSKDGQLFQFPIELT